MYGDVVSHYWCVSYVALSLSTEDIKTDVHRNATLADFSYGFIAEIGYIANFGYIAVKGHMLY